MWQLSRQNHQINEKRADKRKTIKSKFTFEKMFNCRNSEKMRSGRDSNTRLREKMDL